ncbi:MAG TPA: hypothetical protein PKM73_18890 [Verrucomicrobiota bacterium]|nr:hypothetical protein [Verrucomicrobiota bacterium]HNU52957.1 hypothetical protein [Verrucomicrobiota bacterium]
MKNKGIQGRAPVRSPHFVRDSAIAARRPASPSEPEANAKILGLGCGQAALRLRCVGTAALLLLLQLHGVPSIAGAQSPPLLVLENPLVTYTIAANGRNVGFVNRATGENLLDTRAPSSCARVRIGDREHPAAAARFDGRQITLEFGEANLSAQVTVEINPVAIVLTLASVTGGDPEALTFLDVPLTLKATPDEPFGACALALSLNTRIDALPALQSRLCAAATRRFGLTGARAAIVGAPMPQVLPALQQTLAGASQLPVCRTAGPWAHDTAFSHGSYLFNFGALTEANVEDWIAMARSLGFTQIDNHGGGSFFRFGDMVPDSAKWPDGWRGWERIVARLHREGIGSIFHTYAFFIDKRSKYVTPLPDPRLDAFRTFTLAEPVSSEAKELIVSESTAGLSTVTGFFEHNSVLLHLGDELVTFGGVSQQPPWRFTGLQRGAHGTRPAAHPAGTAARHLKECFGLLVPNPESSLFEEIAANHAEVVRQCGFDGVYLDAIDGSSILRGPDEAWYWASRFVVEIQKRLDRPVGMEMSAMWHHFWQYRTRWQAWDYPQRGHLRFVDLHAQSVYGGLLLPLHLGWWGFQSYNPPQIEPTFPEVIETLGARLVGWDAGISLTAGVDRKTLEQTPLFQRAVSLLRACENFRHTNTLDRAAKSRLREPGAEFALVQETDGTTRFRRSQSHPHAIAALEPWTRSWSVTNAFAEQPLRFRLEAAVATPPFADTNAVVLADPTALASDAWKATQARGVSVRCLSPADPAHPRALLVATNAGLVPRNAAWARFDQRFAPPLNLKDHPALEIEIDGDGSGALLAVRLESPHATSFGAIADRYVQVDFTGPRRCTLVETESARWSDYVWNDGKHHYNVYRETIDFAAIESVTLWLQNLPPNRETRIGLGPIRARPLRPATLRNPAITLDGRRIQFPIALDSGSWVEAGGPDDCIVYGPKGQTLGRVIPQGAWPVLRTGPAAVEFSWDPADGPPARARLTLFTRGPMIR